MNRHYRATLSGSSLRSLIYDLETYSQGTLPRKCEKFIEILAERGIKVATTNMYSDFAPYVDFSYELVGDCQGKLIGQTTKFIHRVWYKKNGEVSGEYDISPLAMAEFGAGWYASTNPWDLPSTRGSLGKNGLKDVWYWYDEGGQKHSSEEDHTINPTHPMYMAFLHMMEECDKVAREVFEVE